MGFVLQCVNVLQLFWVQRDRRVRLALTLLSPIPQTALLKEMKTFLLFFGLWE